MVAHAEALESGEAAPPARARVPLGTRRLLKAYWVAFRVFASYAWLRWTASLRAPDAIARLLARKHQVNARRLNVAIHELQGLYIKVGQLLSILTNLLPEEFRRELEGLQDRVPPRPYADVEKRLREAFGGRAPQDVFAEFDETPVASASIAQVHRARLKTGEAVAVKVQYPDVDEIVRVDLRALRRIFRALDRLLPTHGMEQVYGEIRAIVLQELDFGREAANIERIAGNFAALPDVGFPKVFREYSTRHVLVTGWVDGIKVSDGARLDAAGVDRRALARLVLHAYCKQIFTDGVYHADPHPGNLMVRTGPDAPRVVFLDFGAVAEVAPTMRQGLVDIIQGALARDTARIGQALRKMGFVAREADPRILDRIVEYFHQRFQEEVRLESLNLKDIQFDPQKGLEQLADLRRMNISLRDLTEQFHVPREWILLERTLLLLMGLCTELDGAMNPMEVIRPYLEEFVLGKDRDPTRLLMETTKDIALSALALPGELKQFLQRASRGDLEIRFVGLDDGVRTLYALGHQILYTLLMISGVTFGLALDDRGRAGVAVASYAVAGLSTLALLGSLVGTRNRLRRRR